MRRVREHTHLKPDKYTFHFSSFNSCFVAYICTFCIVLLNNVPFNLPCVR